MPTSWPCDHKRIRQGRKSRRTSTILSYRAPKKYSWDVPEMMTAHMTSRFRRSSLQETGDQGPCRTEIQGYE